MKNKRSVLVLLFVLLIPTIVVPNLRVYAESNYVLPYPSFMPGNKLYGINKIFEEIEKYWYFGNFAQIRYQQKLSDKYLVEAKTLFEYKQYLLGYTALQKSNTNFDRIQLFIDKGKKERKNTKLKEELFNAQAKKHIEILVSMQRDTPSSIMWNPEKGKPIFLDINELFARSIQLREKFQ